MKKLLFLLTLLSIGAISNAQVKIGDNPTTIDASSLLELEGVGKTLVLPIMATADAPAAPLAGSIIYNSDSNCVYHFDGAEWHCLADKDAVDSALAALDLMSKAADSLLQDAIDSLQAQADSADAANDSLEAQLEEHIMLDMDTSKINELNTAFMVDGDSLAISDSAGTLKVALADITAAALDSAAAAQDSADAALDSAAVAQETADAALDSAAAAQDAADAAQAAIDDHIAADMDTSKVNELNTAFAVVGDSLSITDSGSTLSVPLSLLKRQVVVNTAAAYTVLDQDDVIIYTGAAPAVITIPAASASKDRVLKIANFASGTTNVDIELSEDIIYEGTSVNKKLSSRTSTAVFSATSSTFGLGSTQVNTVTIVSDGTSWYKIGN